MNIVILGAGGLGSLFGGYLALAGARVTLIARPAHVQAIREKGLMIRGIRGEHRVCQNLVAVERPEEATGEFDWFILGVKAKDSEQALKSAVPLRDRVKAAFSLQNSVIKDDLIRGFFGDEKAVGFVTIEGARLAEPGVVVNHLTIPTTNYIGELDGTATPRVQSLADRFNSVGLGTRIVPNIKAIEWEKLAQICLVSSYLGSTLLGNRELRLADGLSVKEGAEQYVTLAKEILSVLRGVGYTAQNYFAPVSHLRELDNLSFEDAVEFAVSVGKALKARGNRATTSLHEDMLRGRKTEVDYIALPFIQQAKKLEKEVPVLTAAYRIIKTLDCYAE